MTFTFNAKQNKSKKHNNWKQDPATIIHLLLLLLLLQSLKKVACQLLSRSFGNLMLFLRTKHIFTNSEGLRFLRCSVQTDEISDKPILFGTRWAYERNIIPSSTILNGKDENFREPILGNGIFCTYVSRICTATASRHHYIGPAPPQPTNVEDPCADV